jgi:N6-L-threonylcarbamoyladenine synthase
MVNTGGAKVADGERLVLGIETSCDETAAAVVARTHDGRGRILSNIVRSQWEAHRPFGGVVPEIAARAHIDCLDELVVEALSVAGVQLSALDAVAATAGPGLVGGLMVGLVTAKALALAIDKPFLAINHLEAHALTVGLSNDLRPPYLLLLVSGGHTQTLLVRDVASYQRIGTTIDDALGEAFDKTAKLLGLGQPGGPQVERWAKLGDPRRFALPRPLMGRAEPHFSFAGLKTAVRRKAIEHQPLSEADIADLVAQQGVRVPAFVVAGGVAANARLRADLAKLAAERGLAFHVAPIALCGDNAAMVAWAGAERLARGLVDGFDAPVRPRWPLDPDAAPAIGAGVKA